MLKPTGSTPNIPQSSIRLQTNGTQSPDHRQRRAENELGKFTRAATKLQPARTRDCEYNG